MPRLPIPRDVRDPSTSKYLMKMADTFNGQVHWIQCQPDGTQYHGTHRVKTLIALQNCYFEFQVPPDFREIHSAFIYFLPTNTGDFDWTVSTTCPANEEDEATSADSTTANGAVATDDKVGRIDCKAAFTYVRSSDLVGVKLTIDVITVTCINVMLFTFGYYQGILQ